MHVAIPSFQNFIELESNYKQKKCRTVAKLFNATTEWEGIKHGHDSG